jgi:hypothetical protein
LFAFVFLCCCCCCCFSPSLSCVSWRAQPFEKEKEGNFVAFFCCYFVSCWVSVCVLLISCFFEDHSHLKAMMILLVAVVVVGWVESLLFVLVCVRFFFRFRKASLFCFVRVSVSVSVSCLWYPKRKEDEEEDSSLGRFLLFFCFLFSVLW